jgi:hypothetical protein
MPAKSKKQQEFFGIVDAMKEGKIPKKGNAGKVAKSMTHKQIRDFAGTKRKGLPERSPILGDIKRKKK